MAAAETYPGERTVLSKRIAKGEKRLLRWRAGQQDARASERISSEQARLVRLRNRLAELIY